MASASLVLPASCSLKLGSDLLHAARELGRRASIQVQEGQLGAHAMQQALRTPAYEREVGALPRGILDLNLRGRRARSESPTHALSLHHAAEVRSGLVCSSDASSPSRMSSEERQHAWSP